MYETYLQNEREWEESNICYCDKCKKFSTNKRKDSYISVMKALEKELDGEKQVFGSDFGESKISNMTIPNDYNEGLNVSLDKIREFIKLLEKVV